MCKKTQRPFIFHYIFIAVVTSGATLRAANYDATYTIDRFDIFLPISFQLFPLIALCRPGPRF